MKLFADEVKLYTSFSHPSCDLQIVCDKHTSWSEQWQLRIARDKCNVHRFSNSVVDYNQGYTTDGPELPWSNETRDLGVMFDNKLNSNSHVSAIAHKAHV